MLMVGAFVTSAVLVACSTSGAAGLTGKEWQLSAITEKVPAFQGVVPPADQPKYTITFNADGQFTGSADCNQIAGTYTTSGSNGIAITQGSSTMAMCGEGSLDILYIHSLAKAKTYAIANDELTLTLSDEGTLTFAAATAASAPASAAATTGAAPSSTAAASVKPSVAPTAAPTAKPTPKPTAKPTATPTKAPGATAAPAPSTGLTGKAWQLTTITEKVPAFQGTIPAADRSKYTVEFKTDGTFSATADCNTISGSYVTADAAAASGDLAITPSASTTAACADGSFSDLYIIGLTKSSSYAIAGKTLTITLTDQGTLIYE
jgi:heat shock protein HslJ